MGDATAWLARVLIGLGLLLVVLGLVLWALTRLPGLGFLGRLPGDFHWKKDSVEIYFPLATSLLISLLLTLLLNLLFWLKRR